MRTYKKLPVFILCFVFFTFFATPAFAAFSIDPEINLRIEQASEKINIFLRAGGVSFVSSQALPLTPTPTIKPTMAPTVKVMPTSTPTVTLAPTIKLVASQTPTLTPIKSGQASTPTPTIKATPISTPNPSATPGTSLSLAPLRGNDPTPTIQASPTPTSTPSPSIDVHSYIMQEINKFRAASGLPAVKISRETCDFAKIRAKEISAGFDHSGFRNRINNHTIPYANWTRITENIAMTPNYKNVVSMWANSVAHAANMRADTPVVCVVQHGNYYAYEGMKP